MEAIIQTFKELFFDYTLRTVALGGAVIGITAGALGCFLVLRRQSLLGDSVSHSVLPGVVIAFMIVREKNIALFIIGALIVGWLATILINFIINNSKIKNDSAIGIILSAFFGLGLALIVYLNHTSYGQHAGLMYYIFGKAVSIVMNDVIVMSIFALISILLMLLFWKEFKLLIFNKEFGEANGLPMKKIDYLLTSVIVLSIVIGLRIVGVVLIVALAIAPPVSARQWVSKLSSMVLLSAILGGIGSVSGAVLSAKADISAGPSIILTLSIIVLISLLFAPKRGIFAKIYTRIHNRRQFKADLLLTHFYHHKNLVQDFCYDSSFFKITQKSIVSSSINILKKNGYIQDLGKCLKLTEKGINRAISLIEKKFIKG